MQNENFLDKYQILIFKIMTSILVIICLIAFFDIRVFAASGGGNLPYVVDNDSVPFTYEEVVEKAYQVYNNPTFNANLTKQDLLNCENYILMLNDYTSNGTKYWTYHIIIDDTSVDSMRVSLSNNDYDSFTIGSNTASISLYGYGSSFLGKYVTISYMYNGSTGLYSCNGYGYNNNATLNFFSGVYPISYPQQLKQPIVWGTDDSEVATPFAPVVNTHGHGTPPDFSDSSHYIPNPPSNKPTFPSINSPTITIIRKNIKNRF